MYYMLTIVHSETPTKIRQSQREAGDVDVEVHYLECPTTQRERQLE
jgi:hypothetical protein